MTPTLDDMIGALADRERRRLLLALLEHNPQQVDSFDAPENGALVKPDGAKTFPVRMRHIHAPKLEQCGFIEWRREDGEIVRGPNFEELRPLLEMLQAHVGWDEASNGA